jgi:diguanylate cyclase (GGDEF)-like protein
MHLHVHHPSGSALDSALDSDTCAWHQRAACGLVVMAAIAFLAALAGGDGAGRGAVFAIGWVAATALLFVAIGRRPDVSTLLAWPLLDLGALMVASWLVPHAAGLTVSFVIVGFLFVGLTQPPGRSLVLLAPALVAQWLIVDLPPAQAAIRLSIAACLWVAVAELPAWLTSSLRAARQELSRQASTDPLTGLANRRAWEPVLERLLREARTSGPPIAVLILDLDHFKSYNDRHGHLAGDAFLRSFADGIRAAIPDTALAARWGGEEFVVTVPGESRSQALELAERIRGAVPDGQSCSVGVAVSTADDTELTLLGRADAALYRAKEGGRDRVEAA